MKTYKVTQLERQEHLSVFEKFESNITDSQRVCILYKEILSKHCYPIVRVDYLGECIEIWNATEQTFMDGITSILDDIKAAYLVNEIDSVNYLTEKLEQVLISHHCLDNGADYHKWFKISQTYKDFNEFVDATLEIAKKGF